MFGRTKLTGRILLVTLAGIAFASTAVAQNTGKAQSARDISLPAGSLARALDRLTEQLGVQIMYETKLTDGIKVSAINGTLTFEAALKQLLANTGLRAEEVHEKMVVLRRVAPSTSNDSPADQMRVAEGASSKTAVAQSSAEGSDSKDQMVVEGERERPKPFSGASIDLMRTEEDALPFTVFTAEDIKYSGAADLAEFLRNRLPQNFQTGIVEEQGGDLFSGGPESTIGKVDFRGWGGTDKTVFLVNGRRMPEYRLKSGGTVGDIALTASGGNFRGIPLASIERIEVLTSAGSAIYGEGATSGVINVITRQNWSGGQFSLNYENPLDAHAPKRNLSFTYGAPLKFGLSARLSANYSDSTALRLADREDVTTRRFRSLLMERAPEVITQTSTSQSPPILGATTNIRSVNGSPLFGPGTPNFTSVPDGYMGGGGIAAFQSRQGVYNLKLGDNSSQAGRLGRRHPLGLDVSNRNFNIGLDRTFGAGWNASFDYEHSEFAQEGQGTSASTPQFNVPASASTNPFGQDVRVFVPDPGLERPELVRELAQTSDRFVLSLRNVMGEWRGLADIAYWHEREEYRVDSNAGPIVDDPVFGPVPGIWYAAFIGLYDPFVDTRVKNPATAGFYERYGIGTARRSASTRNYQLSLKASGPVRNLPAGALQVAGGAEWVVADRYKTRLFQDSNVDSQTGRHILGGIAAITDSSPETLFKYDTQALFGEANAPLLSEKQAVPLVRALELFASGRVGRQVRQSNRLDARTFVNEIPGDLLRAEFESTPVRQTTHPHVYAFGLRGEIVDGLMFRMSRSIGFKPADLYDVAPQLTDSDSAVEDRQRNGEERLLASSMYLTGGNPDLKPETTQATNFGLILRMPALKGLRISVDYLEAVRDDAITGLSPQTVVDLEARHPLMAARVQREAPEPGAPNGVGMISFIDARTTNFLQIASRSLDITLEHQIENVGSGRLVWNAAVSKNISFKFQVSADSAAVEQVRNSEDQQPKWNGNAQVRWEGQHWTYGWSTRYFDSILVRESYRVIQGSDRIKSALEHDALLGYRFADAGQAAGMAGLLSGTSITLGVHNVFDRTPRYMGTLTVNDLGYARADSLYGRSAWLSFQKGF